MIMTALLVIFCAWLIGILLAILYISINRMTGLPGNSGEIGILAIAVLWPAAPFIILWNAAKELH